MTKETLIERAIELVACAEGIQWMKTHEISDLNSREAILACYREWVFDNLPEMVDQLKLSETQLAEYLVDTHRNVRCEVAKQGRYMDVLVDDDEWIVRCEIARQGYGLDVLVDDESWIVRREVAKQGYGLDVLVEDDHQFVRVEVQNQLDLCENTV